MDELAVIALQPGALTQEGFAPYGQVILRPERVGQRLDIAGLDNRRPHARPSFRTSMSAPIELPLIGRVMERHRFSSQSFVPLDVSRYLIAVAPHSAAGGPDMTRVRAFLARGDQGVHYNADTWHYPMSPLDRPARFAVLMWRDDTSDDIETVSLKTPFSVGPI